jgi:lantibiotic transport system ATP-binding protein
MNCIDTHELTHRFTNGQVALDRIALAVPRSAIYGFLGPNGAGKTTTLRLLLGLLRKQHGSIDVFGLAIDQQRRQILARVGSSIETPSLYAQLNAIENLTIWQLAFHCDRRRVGHVLELVGLQAAARKRVGQYSLGMKQRLAIAIALLHEPELLILDEPTNGLDPHGIVEVRELLQALNTQFGTTIVVSSHILSEVEKIITHLGVIDRGKLVFQGTKQHLIEQQRSRGMTYFDTSDNGHGGRILTEQGWQVTFKEDALAVVGMTREDRAFANRLLINGGLSVWSITGDADDLETAFFDLVGTQDG